MSRHLLFGLVCVLASACSPRTSHDALTLRPCQLEAPSLRARCATFEVSEDPAKPDGPKIELNLAVVEASTEEPQLDPLFILVGGPGQSATRSGALLAAAFRDVRKRREIVLVDQRGTGKSNPLKCEDPGERSLAELLDVEFDAQELRDCLAELDADPRHYTTPIAMDDLDAVRDALGYEQINLWGGSYGTRAALVYMRRHPEHVRRVVLDGVAPTDIKLTLHAGRDAQRALELMYDRCEADEQCQARFPNLRDRVPAIRRALGSDETPPEVEFRHPRTGEFEHPRITPDVFSALVRGILYAPMLVATLPIALERAHDGDWAPLFASMLTIQDSVDADLADGMFLSVVCAEDVPQITEAEIAALSDNFLGETPVRLLQQSCEVWPAAEMQGAYFEPIVEAHPTMVLSGQLDPVTPPSWGELVAGRLPNATHHVVDGLAHGVSSMPCAISAIGEFLDAEDPSAVELDCDVDEANPLMLNPAGAPP